MGINYVFVVCFFLVRGGYLFEDLLTKQGRMKYLLKPRYTYVALTPYEFVEATDVHLQLDCCVGVGRGLNDRYVGCRRIYLHFL
ncbi:hypothetical protein F5Y17DRAFT_362529 [Xylariaceae sp. FL0594]|nr:hypothetical protein F5Y17DRAFT_362529 [Xylariaceae sp. FL0594]